MKLRKVALGQSARRIDIFHPGGPFYIPDVVKKLQDRYGFLQIPKFEDAQSISAAGTQGVTYGHGKFSVDDEATQEGDGRGLIPKEFVIDSLTAYVNGISVNTKVSVEAAELFLDDLVEWITQTFGAIVLGNPPVLKTFLSQVEVELDRDATALIKKVNPLGAKLTSLLEGYGQGNFTFTTEGFSLGIDSTKITNQVLAPSRFLLERLVQSPHDSNLFISSAPLKTADHIELLEEVERLAK